MNDGNNRRTSISLDEIAVKLFDDSEINGGEIVSMVPFVSFLGSQHVDVCEYLAGQRYPDTSIEYKVYVNILATHSVIAKVITGIIFLTQSNRVKGIDLGRLPLDAYFLERVGIARKVCVTTNNVSTSVDLIDKKHKWRLAGKFFLHRFYRVFATGLRRSPALVRSWVEISQDLFPDRYDKDLITIYPFTLNWRRQVKYIKQLRKNKVRWHLWGVPYNFRTALRVLFFMSVPDQDVVDFEKTAYEKHALEMKSMGVKEVFSSDEFEAGAIAMHSLLRSEGITVKNVAHGLSFSCPYVSYDVFQVYNRGQRDYYQRRSDVAVFEVKPRIFASSLVDRELCPDAPVSIVFLDGNFKSSGLNFERKFQDRVVRTISQFAESMEIDFRIKAHPNLPRAEIRRMEAEFGVIVEQSADFLATVTPVFVTLFSAGYYDFRGYGEFLFVISGVEDLSALYGEEVNQVSLADVNCALVTLCAGLPRNDE